MTNNNKNNMNNIALINQISNINLMNPKNLWCNNRQKFINKCSFNKLNVKSQLNLKNKNYNN
jgi:hypothetical protein